MAAKSNVLTITATDAKYLADAMLAAASRDNVTPLLCAARVYVDKDGVHAVATDRYRVHRVHLEAVKKNRAHEFVIDRTMLTWLARNALVFKAYGSVVTFTTTPPGEGKDDKGLIRAEVRADADADDGYGTLSRTGFPVRGTFPTVERLFAEAEENVSDIGSVSLNLEFLAGLRPLTPMRGMTPLIRATQKPEYKKPGPVWFTFEYDGKVRAEALVQPNLLGGA